MSTRWRQSWTKKTSEDKNGHGSQRQNWRRRFYSSARLCRPYIFYVIFSVVYKVKRFTVAVKLMLDNNIGFNFIKISEINPVKNVTFLERYANVDDDLRCRRPMHLRDELRWQSSDRYGGVGPYRDLYTSIANLNCEIDFLSQGPPVKLHQYWSAVERSMHSGLLLQINNLDGQVWRLAPLESKTATNAHVLTLKRNAWTRSWSTIVAITSISVVFYYTYSSQSPYS